MMTAFFLKKYYEAFDDQIPVNAVIDISVRQMNRCQASRQHRQMRIHQKAANHLHQPVSSSSTEVPKTSK
ncbi:hypothetical protein ACEQPO_10115 [Bacillus sp. SL00103]